MARKNKKEAIGLDVQLTKSEAFIEKHLKEIGIGLAVVCLIIVGIFLWNNHQKSQENEAANAIAASQNAFMAEQYEQALNGDGAAEKGLLKIIKEYSGTKTANLAKAYAGLCYFNLNKADEAIKMLSDFDAKDDAVISPAIVSALGNCYADKGDWQKGAELIVKAAKKANNDAVTPVLFIQAGELYENNGQNDKALELYKEIKDKYYRSALAGEIDKYIERASK